MTNAVRPTQGRYILYTRNHIIDAKLVECLQLVDIVSQIYDLMNMIETIQMDNNEFVALKVLILLSPDLGRLKDEQRVQRTQEDVIDALYTYTSSNYKDQPSKYGEILTMCSYITNVSIHFKTFLFNRLKDVESLTTACSTSIPSTASSNPSLTEASSQRSLAGINSATSSSSTTTTTKNNLQQQQQQQSGNDSASTTSTPATSTHNCGLLMELLKGDLLFQPSYSLMS